MLRVQGFAVILINYKKKNSDFDIMNNFWQASQGLADSLEEKLSMRKVLVWTLKKTENWNSNHF